MSGANVNVTKITREFIYKKTGKTHRLPDPNPEMSPKEVQKFYSARFPELVNSSVMGPTAKDDRLEFEFSTSVGIKG